jgi:hypothetical protein
MLVPATSLKQPASGPEATPHDAVRAKTDSPQTTGGTRVVRQTQQRCGIAVLQSRAIEDHALLVFAACSAGCTRRAKPSTLTAEFTALITAFKVQAGGVRRLRACHRPRSSNRTQPGSLRRSFAAFAARQRFNNSIREEEPELDVQNTTIECQHQGPYAEICAPLNVVPCSVDPSQCKTLDSGSCPTSLSAAFCQEMVCGWALAAGSSIVKQRRHCADC